MKIKWCYIGLLLNIYPQPVMATQPFESGISMCDMYEIDGGDGIQDYFSTVKLLKPLDVDWFDGEIEGQVAKLFEVKNVNSESPFRYTAVTSRVTMSISKQHEVNDFASVVVYVIKKSNVKNVNGKNYSVLGIGMSALEKCSGASLK